MMPDQQLRSANGSNGLTPLITGIIRDAQSLIGQQLSLFQSGFKKDLDKTKDAAIPIAVGLAVCQLAGFFLFLTAAHFILWLWPQVPMFAAYGIIGLIVAILGGSLVAIGKSKFDEVGQPAEKAVEGLKENLQWTTKT